MTSDVLSGPWQYHKCARHDEGVIASVDDVAETLAWMARQGTGKDLWGVTQEGGGLVICTTGNGEMSEAHAQLIASIPVMLDALAWAVSLVGSEGLTADDLAKRDSIIEFLARPEGERHDQ